MSDDATAVADVSPETTDSEAEAQTPEKPATDPAELIASARKRQAGAEAARQEAERKAAALETEVAALRAKTQTAEQREAQDLATLQERLRVAEEKAAQADARVAAAYLDAKFPNARKELPEVTDEVRLAKFEAMLADEPYEAPTPQTPNAPKASSQPAKQKERTKDDVLADLDALRGQDLGWFA